MNPRRLLSRAVFGSLMIALAATTVAQQPAIEPSSPTVVAPPAWWRLLNMPDGRTFVTDGGLSIDAKFAKPATLPSVVLAPDNAKGLAARLTLPYDAVVIVTDGQPVGIMMPLQPPSR